MSELICNFQFSKDPVRVPHWALDYLLTRPLQDILHEAAIRTEDKVVPLDTEICALLQLNIRRILRRRWIELDDDAGHNIILTLYSNRDGSVVPFIMIDAIYTAMLPVPARDRRCMLEAQWPPRMSGENILSTCTMCAIDSESGLRLHLRLHISNVRLF